MKQFTRAALSAFMIILGVALSAFAMSVFVLPFDILAPGVTGLGRTLGIYFGADVSLVVWISNIALLLLGLIVLGWRFAASIVLGSVCFPFFLDLFDAMPGLSAMLSDPLYAAICAGVLEGVGLGLVIRAGGSSGGSDVIPIILNRKFRLPIAPVLYAVDFTIIALQLPASDLESVVRSAIYAALYTVVMDRVILLGRGSVQISVVSDKFDEINRRLHALDHGTTLVTARTGLLKRECSVVMCVTHIRYLNEAKRAALDVDPGAFITVSSVRDVSGRGFTLGVERLPLDPPAE